MNKLIIFTRPDDGGLTIVIPCISEDDPHDFLEHHAVDRAMKKDIPANAINPQIVTRDKLPTTTLFRNAWVQSGSNISHDIEKCKPIWQDHMRRARDPLLKSLDIEFMKAVETNNADSIKTIGAQKQSLRDVTDDPGIEKSQSVEELMSVWPDCLGARQ